MVDVVLVVAAVFFRCRIQHVPPHKRHEGPFVLDDPILGPRRVASLTNTGHSSKQCRVARWLPHTKYAIPIVPTPGDRPNHW